MRSSDQANERPYSREELKTLRRAVLQNLFKVHGLKGANAATAVLIDNLLEHFASPAYLSSHPPLAKEKEKEKSVSVTAIPPPPRPSSRAGGAASVDEIGSKAGKTEPRPKNAAPAVKAVKGRPIPPTLPAPSRVTNERPASAAGGTITDVRRPGSRAAGGLSNGLKTSGLTSKGVEASADTQTGQGNNRTRSEQVPPVSVSASSKSQKPAPTASQIPTPPVSHASASNATPLSLPQVEALLRTNDEMWQARLETLERNLNEQVEKLRLEMELIRGRYKAAMRGGPGAGSVGLAVRTSVQGGPNGSRTWSPWENRSNRSVSGPVGGQGQSSSTPSSGLPFSILGKRRHPDLTLANPTISDTGTNAAGDTIDQGGGEAKRVRYLNGTRPGDNTPSTELPPASGNDIPSSATAAFSGPPKTPSPQKASSAFGSDYFSRPGVQATPGPTSLGAFAGGESSLVPRTPSPSRQGVVPDNSQTPRLPADWQADEDDINQTQSHQVDSDSDSDMGTEMEMEMQGQQTPGRKAGGRHGGYGFTPNGVNMVPQFSTTPEPPHRPISPTVDLERSISASSDRLTPGRMVMSTPSNPPSSISHTGAPAPIHIHGSGAHVQPQAQDDRRAGSVPLSTVTELERIDEYDELTGAGTTGGRRSHISPGGQLRFPTIKPTPRLSGLGVPGSSGLKTPHQRTPSLLGPPALISRDRTASSSAPRVRAGSELPSTSHSSSLRIPSRGLSPPPRPRSANAIHGASTPPRSTLHLPFALNLPEPGDGIGEAGAGAGSSRVRSASAEYMYVAMHGLEEEDDLDDLDFEEATLSATLPSMSTAATNTPRRSARAATGANASNPAANVRTSAPGRGAGGAGGQGRGREGEGQGQGRGRGRREMPTPGHRTLLGTERYNDKRFGDIPVGFGMGMSLEGGYGYGGYGGYGTAGEIWDSPGVSESIRRMRPGTEPQTPL